MPTSYLYAIVSLAFDVLSSVSFAPMSGINAPSYTGGVTPLRLPALTLRGYLHVVQDGSAFFPRAFGLVRRVVLFSNGSMETPTGRKTYQEKLRPTPAQERELERVLRRCRTLYNTALEQRITVWKQRGVSVTRYQQAAELKDIRADMPEYAGIHSHVLQDVLARLDKTYQAFFRRVAHGERPGFPRFQGKDRYHSFTFIEYGNGVRLDNGYLVLSKIGRIAGRWSRPLEGTPKTVTISNEADGWYVSFSCADVPTQPLPLTGQETGIDVVLKVFLITA